MKIYLIIKRAVKRWLLRTLQPCREMAPLMSESMERRLTLSEFLKLRLHLLVCAWCRRYLKQIKFMRWIVRTPKANGEFTPSLASEARERIAKTVQNRER